MTFVVDSTHDQIPKEVPQVIDSYENAFPAQIPSEHTTPMTSAGAVVENVTHETMAQIPTQQITQQQHLQQQQQQQQPLPVAENVAPVAAEPPKDLEAASPTKSQPVRKISRFLVSPAILTVTNEKTVQNICVEEPVKSPQPTNSSNQPPNFIQNVQNVTNPSPDKPIDPQIQGLQQQQQQLQQQQPQQQERHEPAPQPQITPHPPPVLNVPTQISGKIAEFISAVKPEGAPFINPTDIISQTNAMEAKEFIQQQLKKPLGPDHINTLEQLKIELENITHVHMMNKLLAENETAQLSPEMAENQLSEEGKFAEKLQI